MYQLTLPVTWKIHLVFHVDLLTPYRETELHSPNFTQPPPDLINGEEEYEVERILDSQHHGRNRKVQYLIKWKGYHDSDNQWVNWDDMTANEALQEYKQQYPNAVSHIRTLQFNTEVPSLMTTPNTDQLKYTLLDILGEPTHLSQSPPSTPPTPQSTIEDVFINSFQPTATPQEDFSINLRPSHTQLGQLHETLTQQLPQHQTDQMQVDDAQRSVDPQITVVSGVV